jgi:hypothetical protein
MAVFLDLNLPHLESAAIVIDGLANESEWAEALVVDEFISYRPVPDSTPTTQAIVRLLSDDRALYVHYTVTDPEPDKISTRYSNRDNIWNGETAGIYVDPAGDGQRAYLFLCNPYGVQADATRVAGQRDSFSWDGQWTSVGQLTDTGYVLEMAIPWSTMRHPESIDNIGISLLHSTYREGQRSGWPRRDPDVSGILIQQAIVGGPGQVDPGKQIHLIPELTLGLNQDGISSTRIGFNGLAPGATLRYDPVPALTILATVNPDFSQVEGDEFRIDVNQRYALYYEEKRPFFLEGQEWLDGAFGPLIYTRSMVMPRVGVRATAEQGDWRTALLSVIDGAPTGTVNEAGGWSDDDVAGHLATNTLARTRRPVGSDGFVGGMFSDKQILGTSMANQVMAMDMRSRLSDSLVFEGGAAGSLTSLADGQRLSGSAGLMHMEHESKNWEGGAELHWIGDNFRAENGYLTNSGLMGANFELDRSFFPEEPAINTIKLLGNTGFEWNLNGDLRQANLSPGVSIRLKKNSWVYVSPRVYGEEYEGAFLTGSGAMWMLGSFPSRYWGINVHGYGGNSSYYDAADPRTVNTISTAAELNLRPTEHVSFAISGSAMQFWEDEQKLEGGFVGRAYLTGFLNQQIWLRSIADYNGVSDSWKIEGLAAWQKGPGTAFYLGGSMNLSEESEESEDTWQTFAKISWALGF